MKELRGYIRKVILQEVNIKSGPISNLLDILDSYNNSTWVFFDTETTGLDPNENQITEIAAIAINPNNWSSEPSVISEFHQKMKLTPAVLRTLNDRESIERKAWEKKNQKSRRPLEEPQDILRMTRYGEKNTSYEDEQEVLNQFASWLSNLNNPVLLAQNAKFDMHFVNARLENRLPRYPVIDTVVLIKNYLIPFLKTDDSTFNRDILDKLSVGKGYRKYFSASMGKVAPALGVSIEGWHSALEDTKMLMQMFKKIYEALSTNPEIDISKEQGRTLSRSRAFKRK